VNIEFDNLEQNHFNYMSSRVKDYQMYIPTTFEANRADIYKIIKISEEEKNQIEQQTDAKMK